MNGEHGYVGSNGRWRVCLRAVGATASTLEPLVAQALNEAGVQTVPHTANPTWAPRSSSRMRPRHMPW